MVSATWAVGVCGFGRCGSTMAMMMLDAGGLPPVDGCDLPPYEARNIGEAWQRRTCSGWPTLDVDAAAAVVVHSRDGTCRPDLSVELAYLAAKSSEAG